MIHKCIFTISEGKKSERIQSVTIFEIDLYSSKISLLFKFSIKSMLNYWINNLIILSIKNLKYLIYINLFVKIYLI